MEPLAATHEPAGEQASSAAMAPAVVECGRRRLSRRGRQDKKWGVGFGSVRFAPESTSPTEFLS
jgi:hypothetical protein